MNFFFDNKQNTTINHYNFMADLFDKETRSRIMSKIRAVDTKPEIKVRKFLFAKGLRYRKNQKNLPGKPDIVLKKYGSVVMVNGCFWHGHKGCPKFKMPKSNVEFWEDKISKNIQRDAINKSMLTALGLKVIMVWECEIGEEKLNEIVFRIKQNRKNILKNQIL